ncbi:hypothetical protein MNEG_4132 [Monoraphidium neglectum]|uniref:Uncharacterized protein n=1 Tax=Monoraphidium neglectum TaxID=145388 RepID=A0A0D2MLV2_9CHLO|nr:hypothetical protein MNEG_4132 [Monoraphidium neglectum]KIZ03830.1 hypothetical protein MNEG_4132 [Monoraphidium neglectum]|eukprot:XP_013902849.1 hypothetical protein MNEG_4132 [Monoraphidium neglectum]
MSTALAPRAQAGVAGAGAGAQAGGGEARVVDRATLEAVCGEWSKDFRRCEPMDDFFSLFGVSMLLRKAARLMRGMRIELKGDMLEVTQICALRWLSVTEAFPLAPHAAPGEHRRRDLRRGPQRGTLEGAAAGAVRARFKWVCVRRGCGGEGGDGGGGGAAA